jgi:hypothetical protein
MKPGLPLMAGSGCGAAARWAGEEAAPGGRDWALNVHEKKQSVFISRHFSGCFPANRNRVRIPLILPLMACSGVQERSAPIPPVSPSGLLM